MAKAACLEHVWIPPRAIGLQRSPLERRPADQNGDSARRLESDRSAGAGEGADDLGGVRGELDFHPLARSGGVAAFLEPGKADQSEPTVLGFEPLYSLLVPGPGGGDDIVSGGRGGGDPSREQGPGFYIPFIIRA